MLIKITTKTDKSVELNTHYCKEERVYFLSRELEMAGHMIVSTEESAGPQIDFKAESENKKIAAPQYSFELMGWGFK